jgi:hypothetical protein
LVEFQLFLPDQNEGEFGDRGIEGEILVREVVGSEAGRRETAFC